MRRGPPFRVRVIAPDLSVQMLDPKQITEAPAREGDYKTYSDGKTLRAPFPAIAPGVVVEEEFVTAETVPFFAPGHVGRVFFGREGVPVAHSVAEFDAPASLPLRTDTLLLNDLKPERTEANGRVTLLFEQGAAGRLRSRGAEPAPGPLALPGRRVLHRRVVAGHGDGVRQDCGQPRHSGSRPADCGQARRRQNHRRGQGASDPRLS